MSKRGTKRVIDLYDTNEEESKSEFQLKIESSML